MTKNLESVTVEKRDGKVVPFNRVNISVAVTKAVKASHQSFDPTKDPMYDAKNNEVVDAVIDEVDTFLNHEPGRIHVERIQDLVERVLIKKGYADTAKEYILYRKKRDEIRNTRNKTAECMEEILGKSSEDSNLKRDNANVNGDTAMGTMLQIGANVSKEYYLDNRINRTAATAHRDGHIHIHDLDFYDLTVTCCQIDAKKILEGGFNTGHGYLREPASILSAAALAAIAIQSDQNDCHGGQSIPNLDYGLSKYVVKSFARHFKDNFSKLFDFAFSYYITPGEETRKKLDELMPEMENFILESLRGQLSTKMTPITHKAIYEIAKKLEENNIVSSDDVNVVSYLDKTIQTSLDDSLRETDKETHQAMEAFVHNLNTMHSRCGAQVPFSSVNLGTDTSPAGRMVTKNLLKAMNEGLGHGETAIFPIVIFKVKEGINYNKEDPNYDLFKQACEVTSRRLFPNFSFIDAPFNKQYYVEGRPETEIAYMGSVTGDHEVYYRYNGKEYKHTFKKMYEKLSAHFKIETFGISKYIDVDGDVDIYDTSSGGFVPCRKVMVTPKMTNWVRIKLANGRIITATDDHPLPVLSKTEDKTFVRTPVADIEIGDKIAVVGPANVVFDSEYWDGSDFMTTLNSSEVVEYSALDMKEDGYDVETASDRFDVSGIVSHNCRTRVIGNRYDPNNEITHGRGNLSFTSINLPRLAIESGGSEEKFFNDLRYYMEVAKSQLLERFEIQAKRHVYNFPFLMGQGVWIGSDKLKWTDEVREVIKNGTLSIGFIGIAETMKCLYGHHHGEGEEYEQKAINIVKFMRNITDQMAEETGLNFSLLATPAEGLCGRFLRIDRKKFGVIEGVTDKEFYTNSFHIPVNFKISAFDKIRLEAPFHELTNAGHITYIEFDGDTSENIASIEKVVRCMHDQGIGYGAINHPVDRDPVCGYTGIIGDTCPCCGRKESEDHIRFERIRRITG